MRIGGTCLHWSSIDKETVKRTQGLASTIGAGEDDSGNATADTTSCVGDIDALNWADGLDKVFLFAEKGLVS